MNGFRLCWVLMNVDRLLREAREKAASSYGDHFDGYGKLEEAGRELRALMRELSTEDKL